MNGTGDGRGGARPATGRRPRDDEALLPLIAGRSVVRRYRSASNTVLVVDGGPTRRSVLKVYPDHRRFANETAALGVLAEAGMRAPQVLAAAPAVSGGRAVWTAELSFVPGEPMTSGRGLTGLLHQLRAFGTVTGPGAGTVAEAERGAGWTDWLAARLDAYEAVLGPLDAPRVVDALERTRRSLPSLDVGEPSLLHADLSRPNILVGRDGAATLIDWELGRWGDPLFDVALACYRGLFRRFPLAVDFARELRGPRRDCARVLRAYLRFLHLRELALVEQVGHASLRAVRRRLRRHFGLP
ncbi:phosphotransferase enzyme family protein [Streptomyces chartreusis]|uniref:phosphotransferase enzyme family protein n=1 Tax=Streptomyces chartreusis TaxID=1969 RepID=UPI0033A9F8D8